MDVQVAVIGHAHANQVLIYFVMVNFRSEMPEMKCFVCLLDLLIYRAGKVRCGLSIYKEMEMQFDGRRQ